MLHDAGRAFGTQHTAIHRMIWITLDITDLPVLDMDIDSASTRAHVASGLLDDVADWFLQVEIRLTHIECAHVFALRQLDLGHCEPSMAQYAGLDIQVSALAVERTGGS